MIRVLRLNDYTGPPGGAEAYIGAVMAALTSAGHPQRLLTVSDVARHLNYRPLPGEEVLPLDPMGPRRLYEDLVEAPSLTRRLAQILEEFRPDVIHLHHFDSLFSPLAKALETVPVPIVMTAHDAKLVCPIATLTLPDGRICEGKILPRCQFTGCHVGFGLPYKLEQSRVFGRHLRSKVRLFLAPSHAAATFLTRHGFTPAKVLPPFIDVPPSVDAAPAPLPSGPPTVGFLGRFHPYKGALTLLEAFARVHPDLPEARLVLAGRGPQEPELRARAQALGLGGSVEFPGWVEGPAKERFFDSLHLLAVPSEGYENFGLIGLEAMVRGRGVLGSHQGGIPDWLEDRVTGRLLPPGNVDAWRHGLQEALTSNFQLTAWGQAGRRAYMARFRPEVHVRDLLETYEQVLETPAMESPAR